MNAEMQRELLQGILDQLRTLNHNQLLILDRLTAIERTLPSFSFDGEGSVFVTRHP